MEDAFGWKEREEEMGRMKRCLKRRREGKGTWQGGATEDADAVEKRKNNSVREEGGADCGGG